MAALPGEAERDRAEAMLPEAVGDTGGTEPPAHALTRSAAVAAAAAGGEFG